MKKLQYSFFALLLLTSISCKKEKEVIDLPSKPIQEVIIEKKVDTINWYTELCEMNSSFATDKYSKKQLQDTFKLWFSGSSYIDFNGYPVFELDKKLDQIEKLENSYKQKKSDIEKLEIVNIPYWQNIKKLKLEDLKLFYEFEKNGYFAYSNIKLLSKTSFDKKAKIYVDALVSQDSLQMITAWTQLNEEQKAANGGPNEVEQKFQNRLNSYRCLEYAKMELFSFGWANNALKTCKDCGILNRNDILENEFKKLFLSTNETCSEP